jgi:hypothetical protein
MRARTWLVGVLCGAALPVWSAEATSAEQASTAQAIDVAGAKAGVFHHLDAAGRNSLAVSGDNVALVWEDNRGGAPGCYLALKQNAAPAFEEFAFGQGECFEPAVAAFDAGRFLLIWEDASGVNAALADAAGPGPAARLADSGGQGTLAVHARLGAFAAWSAPDGRWRRIWQAPLRNEGKQIYVGTVSPADPSPAADDQTFPVLAASAQGVMLAWEDRRHGHTVIFGSSTRDAKSWSAPVRISGNPTGKQAGDLGRGTGAMRPALATFGERIAATWLDKRDFLSGYDVYAALTGNNGGNEGGNGSGKNVDGLRFAKDQKAQDSFGDAIAQWHVAVAGNARGELLIAWDDDRDGSADIWLTRLNGAGFGENFTLPEASGPGRQSDPALTLDATGNLHLSWIDRDDAGLTRLRYLRHPLPQP